MNNPHSVDSRRAAIAAAAIIDGRNPKTDFALILVTAEHAVATLLLSMFPPSMAAQMLNEALLEGIERRLALYNARALQK